MKELIVATLSELFVLGAIVTVVWFAYNYFRDVEGMPKAHAIFTTTFLGVGMAILVQGLMLVVMAAALG